jgi:hypothetical protein
MDSQGENMKTKLFWSLAVVLATASPVAAADKPDTLKFQLPAGETVDVSQTPTVGLAGDSLRAVIYGLSPSPCTLGDGNGGSHASAHFKKAGSLRTVTVSPILIHGAQHQMVVKLAKTYASPPTGVTLTVTTEQLQGGTGGYQVITISASFGGANAAAADKVFNSAETLVKKVSALPASCPVT